MRGGPRTQPGFVAALLHRLSGTALAIFAPLHFIALATVLNGANELDRFLSLTNDPLVKLSEAGLFAAGKEIIRLPPENITRRAVTGLPTVVFAYEHPWPYTKKPALPRK